MYKHMKYTRAGKVFFTKNTRSCRPGCMCDIDKVGQTLQIREEVGYIDALSLSISHSIKPSSNLFFLFYFFSVSKLLRAKKVPLHNTYLKLQYA